MRWQHFAKQPTSGVLWEESRRKTRNFASAFRVTQFRVRTHMSESATGLPPEPSASQAAVPQPASANIFRGPNGIRAGWRVLIFLAIVVGLVAAVNLVVWMVMHFLLHRP